MTIITETTTASADSFEEALRDERVRITAALDEVNGELTALIAASSDPATAREAEFSEEGGEGSTSSAERDRLEVLRAELTTRLGLVGAGLERVATGTYGTCASCGGPIGDERLRAIPEATLCVTCKSSPPWRRLG